MDFFRRAASIQIGTNRYSMNELNFEFEVPFEDSTTLQTASITAYNLSETTRKGIKKGNVIILNAGYQDDMGVIFVGQVAACTHSHNGTDWITKITAAAAMDQWLNSKVNKTYQKKIMAQEIIRDLLNLFGLEVGVFELALNKQYPRGRICSGKVKDVLTQIVTKECKSRLLIKDGKIVINDLKKGLVTSYILTRDSGLLVSANDAEEAVIDAGTVNKETKYVKRECLLNYHLGPAEQIQIRSETLNGRFLIAKGKHTGSPTGAWKTTIELIPV